MTFFFLFWLLWCAIFTDANDRTSTYRDFREVGAPSNADHELYQPREVMWSGQLPPISLQVKGKELKNGKTGRIYYRVRTPSKVIDRQLWKQSRSFRKSMKSALSSTDGGVRKGTILAHKLARRGVIGLDKKLSRGSKIAHDYLRKTSKSFDDKLVAGTRSAHSKVKHTLLPVDKGIVHGSSRAYTGVKRAVTTVDKRIKKGVLEVDQHLAAGNKVPVKVFMNTVFKSKGKKSLTNAAEAAPASEPEPVAMATPDEPEVPESASEAAEPIAESIKSVESATADEDEHHLLDSHEHHEENPVAEGKDASAESFKDEMMSDTDTGDNFEDAEPEGHDQDHNEHDNGHDHSPDNSHADPDSGHDHNDLADHADDNQELEGMDHLDDFEDPDEHHDHGHDGDLDGLDHDHHKETDAPDHHEESANLDGQPRSVHNKTKKKHNFQDKFRQVVPNLTHKMMSAYGRAALQKNLSRSLTKISNPSKSATRGLSKTSKAFTKSFGGTPKMLTRNINKTPKMLRRSVSETLSTLTKSASAAPKSLTSLTRSIGTAPKSLTPLTRGISEAPKSLTTLTKGISGAPRSLTSLTRGIGQVPKSLASLSRSMSGAPRSLASLTRGINKPAQSLSKGIGSRALTKKQFHRTKALTRSHIPQSLSKIRMPRALKSRLHRNKDSTHKSQRRKRNEDLNTSSQSKVSS